MGLLSNNSLLIIITGDCTVTCLDSFSAGLKPMVTLSLAELPGSTRRLILAMGGLDNKIHLYCGERTGQVRTLIFSYVLASI